MNWKSILFYPGQDSFKRFLMGQLDLEMPQSKAIFLRRWRAPVLPDIESDMVVVTSRRDKTDSDRVILPHSIEPQHLMEKNNRFGQIPDMEVNMAHLNSFRQGDIQAVLRFEVFEQGFDIQRLAAAALAASPEQPLDPYYSPGQRLGLIC